MQQSCHHCAADSFAYAHPLKETDAFRVVCDVHPLTEGHILIIPKQHIPCIGACDASLFSEFRKLHDECVGFLQRTYGMCSVFEHGVTGQTVFHAHVHFVPYGGTSQSIVPEGQQHLTPVAGIDAIPPAYKQDGQYLYVAIGSQSWFVDTDLSTPRFFRDRFARALGHPERGNWKNMHEDAALMSQAAREIAVLEEKWQHNK